MTVTLPWQFSVDNKLSVEERVSLENALSLQKGLQYATFDTTKDEKRTYMPSYRD